MRHFPVGLTKKEMEYIGFALNTLERDYTDESLKEYKKVRKKIEAKFNAAITAVEG